MKGIVKWLMFVALVALMASCTTPAKLAYLRDMKYDNVRNYKNCGAIWFQLKDEQN